MREARVEVAICTAADDGDDGDSWPEAVGSAWIVAVLGWFPVPVLGRTFGRVGAERVIGRGRFEVELSDGETLVVRSNP